MRRASLLLALIACGKPEKVWIDVRATQLHVGTLEVNIPSAWRDFNELVHKPAVPLPKGSRTILLEQNPNLGRIMVLPVPMPIQRDQCDLAAQAAQEQLGDKATLSNVEGANFNGSKGCMMKLSSPNGSGKLAIVTPAGGSTVSVVCVGHPSDVDDACDAILYGLHVTPQK